MQQNIFELTKPRFKFDKPIKIFEAFSGVGMQLLALNKLGVNYESVGYSEIDFYKAQSVCSNTQLYKQAGNGIVVDVLVAIFKKLY